MNIQISFTQALATISFQGRLDQLSHDRFHEIMRQTLDQPNLEVIELEMEQLESINSIGLGLMILLRNKAYLQNIPVQIRGCNEMIHNIFHQVHFHKLFKIIDKPVNTAKLPDGLDPAA